MRNKSQEHLSQIILVIGTIIAAIIIVIQVRSIFFAQSQLAQMSVVETFADDISTYVDKLMTLTSDASFIYKPDIKKYTLEVKNNIATIYDKTSDKKASFSKSSPPELIKSYIEDDEEIVISKKGEKIYILGSGCKKSGEGCRNALSCCQDAPYCWGEKNNFICKQTSAAVGQYAADDDSCSTNYLDKFTEKCDIPSSCPDVSVCPGAPETFELGGIDCCPKNKPICSHKHCCPSDEPLYCKNPAGGNSRCMDEEEFKKYCITPLKLIIIPVNYKYLDYFKESAREAVNYWIGISPFKECPDSIEIIIEEKENCKCNPVTISCIYSCAVKLNYIPKEDLQGNHWRLVGISQEWDLGRNVVGFTDCSKSCCDKNSYNAKVVWITEYCELTGKSLESMLSKYLGFTFGLCGKVDNKDIGPTYCNQPACSEINYPLAQDSVMNEEDMLRYSVSEYDYMKNYGIVYPIKYYCGD